MKWLAISFTLFMLAVIFLADRGAVPAPIQLIYQFPNGDRAGHFVLYSLFTFLVNAAFPRYKLFAGKKILIGTLVIATFAVIEEFSQIFISRRTFDLIDLTFSLLGIFFADWLFRLLRNRQLSQ